MLSISLALPISSYGFFGNPADTVALMQILANNIKQLIQLRNIIQTAKRELDLIRDINSGIDYAIGVVKTKYPNQAIDLYSDWKSSGSSRGKLFSIYGSVPKSGDETIQRHLDQSVVDTIVQSNQTVENSDQVDGIGERIKEQSMGASPKGAARLAAQALGVGLHVQNQTLRVQASQLKLDAQKLAVQNKKDKEEARMFMHSSNLLKNAMQSQKDSFQTPRF